LQSYNGPRTATLGTGRAASIPGYIGDRPPGPDTIWWSSHINHDSGQYQQCDKVGNPCVPATGAKEYSVADFEWSGITLNRNYSSLRHHGLSGGFGGSWNHDFADRLFFGAEIQSEVLWIDGKGNYESLAYDLSHGLHRSSNISGATLRNIPGAANPWVLVQPNGKERAFGAGGRLKQIGTGSEAVSLYYCDEPGQSSSTCMSGDSLASAVAARGRTIRFHYSLVSQSFPNFANTYEHVRLSTITDAAGVLVTYQYDGRARLVAASYPALNGSSSIQYRYAEHSNLCRLANGAVENNCDAVSHAAFLPDLLTGIIDENGVRTADYTYDSKGRVTQSQHAGNAKRVSLSYLSPSQVRVTQPEGGSRLYTFSTGRFRKLLSSVEETTDGSVTGTTTHNVNASTFRRNYTVDARGTRTNYTFDAFRETGRTEALTAAGASTALTRSTSSTWDNTLNRMLTRTEPGREIRYAYNGRGQATARCEIDLAKPAAVAYAQCGSAANAPVGVRQSRYVYCEAADVAAANSTCPILGALKFVDGPRTDVADTTTYSYYAATDESGCASANGTCRRKGDLWKVINALGHVTTHTRYDRSGRLTHSTDANGVLTIFSYHPRGWLLSRTVKGATAAEDAVTRFAYTATGLVERITQPDGSYLVYGYDDAHRLISVTDPLGNRIDYTLDPAGNRTAETTYDPQGTVKRQLSRVYNQLGRLKEQRDAQLRAYLFGYDANGNSTSTRDPLSVDSTQLFDPLNRLQQSLQDVGGINVSTEYGYDAQDRLTKVIDPKGLHTDYSYSGLGDLTQLSSPDTGVTGYTVDVAGNRLTQTDARGVTVTMQYDVLNRLSLQTNSADAEVIVYRYDGEGLAKGLCEGSFGRGRLSQIEDSLGTLSYCYDRRGNVVAKHRVGLPNYTEQPSLEWSIRYRYTRADQLESLQYPDGEIVIYHRDAAGRVRAVDYIDALGSSAPLITQIDYAPFGPPTRMVYANGSEWTRALDADYRIDRITTPAFDYDYTLDAVGNITDIAQGAASRSFEYDDLYRLTEMKQGTSVLEGFGYDATGNRTSASIGGAQQSYVYPGSSHRLESVAGEARSYTPAGNTAAIGPRSLHYSGFNRLSEIQQGGISLQSSAYNGRGERELRRAGGSDRYFGYDEAGRLLFEGAPRAGFCAETNMPPPPDDDKSAAARQAKGAIDLPICPGFGVWIEPSGFETTQRILWLDDQPIAIKNSVDAYAGELLYVHADHLGSPRAITRPAAGNAVVWRWTLEGSAFGQHAAAEDPDRDGVSLEFNLRYPGQYFDFSTRLHYNYFRDYEAGVGRYVQSDPIGLEGGVSTYGYGAAAPFDFFDRLGLFNMTAQQTFEPSTGQYVWDYAFSFSSCRAQALLWVAEQTAGRANKAAKVVGRFFDIVSPDPAGDADISDLERRCKCLGYDPQLEDYFSRQYGDPSRSLSDARATQALLDLRGELGKIRRKECDQCANDHFYDWDTMMEKARARGTRSIHLRAREISNQ
jgi:RHS repeat-associated protein